MNNCIRPKRTHDAARRLFLRHAGTLGALAGAGAPMAINLLAAGNAAAQSAGDYKALVCIFLFGGNDTYNMVLPTDGHNGTGAPTPGSSWAAYSSTRNQTPDSLALMAPGTAPVASAAAGSPMRLGGVLPISPLNAQGRTLALHPVMGGLQTLFDTDRRLAVLPNIGPLILPTSKAQYSQNSHRKPASLFSHNDQQNTWQSLGPEGTTQGWGGRMGDMVAGMNSNVAFTSVSASGNAVWLSGQTVRQYQVGSNGAIRMGADSAGRIYGSTDVAAALERVVSRSRGSHVFEADLAAVSARSLNAELTLRTGLRAASDPLFGTPPAGTSTYSANNDPKLRYNNPLTGSPASNQLAQQLQVVARMIDAGISGVTGVRRQVFFVSMGGFDTHDNQNRGHADLMARLSHAMQYFDTTLGGLGARNNVTTFTASDFGRTFTSNGDGTDHGWGAHHFVMGGAVRGGDLYGRFPTLAEKNRSNNNFDGSPDQLGNGSLLPATSVDQLGATLGRWFGLSDGQVADIFPNLANFDAGSRNLGFMT
ncbi:MAG: DUF1501 domain-containing protein [Rubrivivax sp.]|nr:DUF1501 domain-containing protein [Rubrivivax sp.]MDP3614601.1 DUF1501 domain-containing protein [Rubrivivax sp.]